MKTTHRQLVAAVAIGTLAVCSARAQANMQSDAQQPASTPPDVDTSITYPQYHSQEFSVDLFGVGTTREHDFLHYYSHGSLYRPAQGGGGAGLNYFFSKYVGIGGEFYSDGTDPSVTAASGNVIGRLPLGDTGLAPYIMAGGGHEFIENGRSFGQAGAGLEFRFIRHWGLFVDGRGVLPGRDREYGEFRGGLRINF